MDIHRKIAIKYGLIAAAFVAGLIFLDSAWNWYLPGSKLVVPFETYQWYLPYFVIMLALWEYARKCPLEQQTYGKAVQLCSFVVLAILFAWPIASVCSTAVLPDYAIERYARRSMQALYARHASPDELDRQMTKIEGMWRSSHLGIERFFRWTCISAFLGMLTSIFWSAMLVLRRNLRQERIAKRVVRMHPMHTAQDTVSQSNL